MTAGADLCRRWRARQGVRIVEDGWIRYRRRSTRGANEGIGAGNRDVDAVHSSLLVVRTRILDDLALAEHFHQVLQILRDPGGPRVKHHAAISSAHHGERIVLVD